MKFVARAADNGRTLTVGRGTELVVILDSTSWTFAAAKPPVAMRTVRLNIRTTGPSRGRSCPPGQGCGTVTGIYRAESSGRAQITAARSSCGEARACLPREATYQLTVVVSG